MRSLLVASLTLLAGPALAQSIDLAVNEAQPVHMARPITGVVVGNAGVADIIVHDANLLFVLGKSVGQTSVVAVDASGRTVFAGTVVVRAADGSEIVVIQRGAASTTAMNCGDRCIAVVSPYAGAEQNTAIASNATAQATFARGGGGN